MRSALNNLPGNVKELSSEEKFRFGCHSGVNCFTDCCRELELALTPYDVLRLRRSLNMNSTEFLNRHAVIEQEPGEIFPRVYLGMVDDGKASCPFVTPDGCLVYENRPGACRIYPLGRAACRNRKDAVEDHYVIITEPHCHGFHETTEHTIDRWIQSQGLQPYNECNDLLLTLYQHDQIKQGATFTEDQIKKYMMALFDLDMFSDYIKEHQFKRLYDFLNANYKEIHREDVALLKFGIRWITYEFFGV